MGAILPWKRATLTRVGGLGGMSPTRAKNGLQKAHSQLDRREQCAGDNALVAGRNSFVGHYHST